MSSVIRPTYASLRSALGNATLGPLKTVYRFIFPPLEDLLLEHGGEYAGSSAQLRASNARSAASREGGATGGAGRAAIPHGGGEDEEFAAAWQDFTNSPWGFVTSRYAIALFLMALITNRIQHICRPRGRSVRLSTAKRLALRLPSLLLVARATLILGIVTSSLFFAETAPLNRAIRTVSASGWREAWLGRAPIGGWAEEYFGSASEDAVVRARDAAALWASFTAICVAVITESLVRSLEAEREEAPSFNLVGFAFLLHFHSFSPDYEASKHVYLCILLQTSEVLVAIVTKCRRRPLAPRLVVTSFFGIASTLHYLLTLRSGDYPFMQAFGRAPEIGLMIVILLTVALHALTMLLTEERFDPARLVFSRSNLPSMTDDWSLALFKLGSACLESTRLTGLSREVAPIQTFDAPYIEMGRNGEVCLVDHSRISATGGALPQASLSGSSARGDASSGLHREVKQVRIEGSAGDRPMSVLSSPRLQEAIRFSRQLYHTLLALFVVSVNKVCSAFGLPPPRVPDWVYPALRKVRLLWHGRNGEERREQRLAEERRRRLSQEARQAYMNYLGSRDQSNPSTGSIVSRMRPRRTASFQRSNSAVSSQGVAMRADATEDTATPRSRAASPSPSSSILDAMLWQSFLAPDVPILEEDEEEDDDDYDFEDELGDDEDDEEATSEEEEQEAVLGPRYGSATTGDDVVFNADELPLLDGATAGMRDDNEVVAERGLVATDRLLLAHFVRDDDGPPLTRSTYRNLVGLGSSWPGQGEALVRASRADRREGQMREEELGLMSVIAERRNELEGRRATSGVDMEAERRRLCVVCCVEESAKGKFSSSRGLRSGRYRRTITAMSDSSVSSYFSNLFTSSTGRNALFLGSIALGSSLATAVAIFGTQRLTRQKKRKDLGDSIRQAAQQTAEKRLDPNLLHPRDESSSSTTDAGTPRYLAGLQSNHLRPNSGLRHSHSFNTSTSIPPTLTPSASRRQTGLAADATEWDESLIREQLSRNYSFLGDEGMERIRNSFVVVVGAGGVGSWAALMLLRSGVGKLRLIDFDQVSLSSLNRHACANLADVGRPKVVCCAEKFGQIAPWAKLEAWVELFRGDEAPRLLGGAPTYVVDAIDNIDTKVELLRYCAENGIKVISSMGAGAKSDPSRVQISDISTTTEDPLARSVRRRLRALGLPPIPPKEVDEGNQKKQQKSKAASQPSTGNEAGQQAKGSGAPVPPQIDLERTPVKGSDSRTPPDAAQDGSSNRFLSSTGTGAAAGRSPLVRSPLGGSPLASPRNGSSDNLEHLVSPPAASTGPATTTSAAASGTGSVLSPRIPPPSMPLPPIRKMHSRRASSVSSFGSAAYATPMSTPSDEMAALLPPEEEDVLAPLDQHHNLAEGLPSDTLPSVDGDDPVGSAQVDEQAISDHDEDNDAEIQPRHGSAQEPAGKSSYHRHVSRTSEIEELLPGSTTSSPAVSRSTSYRHASQVNGNNGLAGDATTAQRDGAEPDSAPEATFFIPCVYSTEKSDTRLLPLDEDEFQKGSVDELAALEDFRVRILPVLGPIPAMFGLAVATYIICELGGHRMEPLAFKGRRKLYEKILNDLSVTEARHPVPNQSRPVLPPSASGPRQHTPFNVNDIAYLFEEVFRGRSVVPPFEPLSAAQLERWDSTLPLSYSNVALFSRAEAKVHEREVLKRGRSPIEVWGTEAAGMVKRRMASERVSGFFR